MKVNMHCSPLFGGPIKKPVAPSKLKAQVASCNDEDKLVELLKRLKYLEGILGTGEGKDYAI